MVNIFISEAQHWEMLSINFDCVWAPSISIYKQSASPHPAVVLRSVGPIALSAYRLQQHDLSCCGGDDSSLCAQQSLISCCWASLSLVLFICFSCKTLARSRLKPNWISMALGATFLLTGVVQLVRLDGWKTPWAMMVSKSAAPYPKTPAFSFSMLLTVFLP